MSDRIYTIDFVQKLGVNLVSVEIQTICTPTCRELF